MIQNSQMYKKGGIFNLFSKNKIVDTFPEENKDYITLLTQAERNLKELEKDYPLDIKLPHGQLSSIIKQGNYITNKVRRDIELRSIASFVNDFHKHVKEIRSITQNDTLKSELTKSEKLVNEYLAFIDRNSL